MSQALVPQSAPQLPDRKLTATKILVATDFSRASDLALDYALVLARRSDAQLYLAHILPTGRPGHPEALPAAPLADAAWQAAERTLAAILVSGRLRDIPHEVLLERGSVWSTLAALIQKHEIDLVVTGSHRHGSSLKPSIGAVAGEILAHATCAVLTVPPSIPRDDEAGAPVLRNVLFATDFGPAAQRTAAFALALAREHGARLTILHIIEDNLQNRPVAAAETRPAPPSAHTLAELALPAAESCLTAECRSSSSRLAREILAHARKSKADLLVMDAECRKTPAADAVPSISLGVILKAHCPVLTMRVPPTTR